MHFSKDLYVSDSLKKEKNRFMRFVKYNIGHSRGFIVYKRDYDGCYEFMHTKFINQKFLKARPLEIVAITKDYEEAINYVAGKVCESYGVLLCEGQ